MHLGIRSTRCAAAVVALAASTAMVGTEAAAAATDRSAGQTIKRLRAQIVKQQRAIDLRNQSIQFLRDDIAVLQEERDAARTGIAQEREAARALLTTTVQQQINAMPVESVWVLMPTIYGRFPREPLAAYSASFFQSGTYRNYSFTFSP
jgi:hypothetical protein